MFNYLTIFSSVLMRIIVIEIFGLKKVSLTYNLTTLLLFIYVSESFCHIYIYIKEANWSNHAPHVPSPHNQYIYIKENVRFTTPIQQLYNNPSHEGESHILGSTLM
jgi:hypothetical protein